MKIDRLFAITNLLINKKTITAAELAEKFEVSIRTIYRDMDILSSCGIPIYTEKGRNGGISMMERYTLSKTLLTDEEQKQIIMALQSVHVTGKIEVSDALLKLSNVFQKNVQNWIEIDFSYWEHNERDQILFSTIRDSILDTKAISFSYFNGKGEKTSRVVEPLKVIFKGQSWYLYAYCRTRKDFRFFKLSRIDDLKQLNETFQMEIPESVSTTYAKEEKEAVTMKLKFDKSVAFRVLDEFRNGIIERVSDGLLITTCMSKSDWLLGYLLGFGDSLTILEPQEMKEEFLNKIQKIREKY